jgi:hypothetical protein
MGTNEYFYIAIALFARSFVGAILALIFGALGYVSWFGLRYLLSEYWAWIIAEWHYELWIGAGAAVGAYLAWLIIRQDLAVLTLKAPEYVSGLLSRAWGNRPSISLLKPLSEDWVGKSIRLVTSRFWATIAISAIPIIALGFLGAWGGFEWQEGKGVPAGYASRITTPPIQATIFGAALVANVVLFVLGVIHQVRNQGR